MARMFSGPRLREAREAANIKPERLAMLADKSVYSIHRYEQGTTFPPVAVAAQLAEILGVAVDDLLTEVAHAV